MLHSAYEKSPTTKMFHFINQLLIKIGRHGFIEIVGSAHALVYYLVKVAFKLLVLLPLLVLYKLEEQGQINLRGVN